MKHWLNILALVCLVTLTLAAPRHACAHAREHAREHAHARPVRVEPAPAAPDVQVDAPKGPFYEGVPLRVYVRIKNAADFNAPEVPEIPGATARVQVVESSQSQVIRNGQRSRTVTVTYAIDITPEQPGTLALPVITVKADGDSRQYALPSIEVQKSESSDVFSSEVFGTPPEVFIGQSLELVLRIAVKPFRDPTYGQLNEVQMWQMMNMEGTEWGVFLPTMQRMAKERRNVPRVQTEMRDGSPWFVFEIPCTIWPPKSGPPDLGKLMIRMNYPVALREERGFLGGSQLIPDTRPVSAQPSVHNLTVLPLPEEGKPAGFTGAVGLFSIQATAKPASAAVGDPVTLTLTVTDRTAGEANLDTLQPPALADIAALKQGFRVPSEPLSGTVEGRRKTFMQTIRPLRADLTEIPAIPFSFFDPDSRSYRTVSSEPIAITVRPGSAMDISRIEHADNGARTETAPPGTQLTEVEGGLTANLPVTPAILANDRLRWSPALLLALAVPPLAVAAAAAWRAHRRRHERDRGLARRSRARRTAERRLNGAADAAGIARAVTGFVEDRLGRAEGTMTHGDLRSALDAHRVAEPDRAAALAVLDECNRAVYSGAGGAAEVSALRARAATALDALDRAAWLRHNGGAA